MMTKSVATRAALERDITEALLRLKLARAQRDRKEMDVCDEKLNRLLDRLSQELKVKS
jgi:hypothetical protein